MLSPLLTGGAPCIGRLHMSMTVGFGAHFTRSDVGQCHPGPRGCRSLSGALRFQAFAILSFLFTGFAWIIVSASPGFNFIFRSEEGHPSPLPPPR